jgi:hypothetical protein
MSSTALLVWPGGRVLSKLAEEGKLLKVGYGVYAILGANQIFSLVLEVDIVDMVVY